jgi:hypothetical protein
MHFPLDQRKSAADAPVSGVSKTSIAKIVGVSLPPPLYPVSWSVPIRISSSGLNATEWVELAGSNRKMVLFALGSAPALRSRAGAGKY